MEANSHVQSTVSAEQLSTDLQKAQARVVQLERIVQDGESRCRELQAELDKRSQASASETDAGARALIEKDQAIALFREEVAAQRLQVEDLQIKVKDLESAVKKEKVDPRIDEARYLAGDLGKSLAAVSSQLGALVEHVKLLHETLDKPGSGVPDKDATPAPAMVEIKPLPEPMPGEGGLPAEEMLKQSHTQIKQHAEPEGSGPLAEETASEQEGDSMADGSQKKGFFGKLFGKKK